MYNGPGRQSITLIGLMMLALSALASPERLDPSSALRVESNLIVGNKGEESIEVSQTSGCGKQWLFSSAELVINRNRFGGAQFVSLPPPGCRTCDPVRVRWFHEPTGYLDFSIEIRRRQVHILCDLVPTNVDASGNEETG